MLLRLCEQRANSRSRRAGFLACRRACAANRPPPRLPLLTNRASANGASIRALAGQESVPASQPLATRPSSNPGQLRSPKPNPTYEAPPGVASADRASAHPPLFDNLKIWPRFARALDKEGIALFDSLLSGAQSWVPPVGKLNTANRWPEPERRLQAKVPQPLSRQRPSAAPQGVLTWSFGQDLRPTPSLSRLRRVAAA